MKSVSHIALAVMLLLCVPVLPAKTAQADSTAGADSPTYEVTRIADNFYRLTEKKFEDATALAFTGPDGLLLVDTGFAEHAADLQETLSKQGWGMPKVIINSHYHADHIGGNALLGKEALVIAHANVRKWMTDERNIFEEFPEWACPRVLVENSVSLVFNGEEIRITALPASHTDSGCLVHFVHTGIAYVGAMVPGPTYPSIDQNLGGKMENLDPAYEKLLTILPENTRAITGHGSEMSMAELKRLHEVLQKTRDTVLRELAKGKDAAAIMKEGAIKAWDDYGKKYCTPGGWIQQIAASLDLSVKPARKSITPILYRALQQGGAAGAIAICREYRRDHADEYTLSSNHIYKMGQYLLKKDRATEAIPLFEYGIAEFPDTAWLYVSLADAQEHSGQPERALQTCRDGIKKSPAPQTYYALMQAYVKRGNKAAAIKTGRQAAKVFPELAAIFSAEIQKLGGK